MRVGAFIETWRKRIFMGDRGHNGLKGQSSARILTNSAFSAATILLFVREELQAIDSEILGIRSEVRGNKWPSSHPLASQTNFRTVPGTLTFSLARTNRCSAIVRIAVFLLCLAGLVNESRGDPAQKDQKSEKRLTEVSLEDLGKIEVTTASKE